MMRRLSFIFVFLLAGCIEVSVDQAQRDAIEANNFDVYLGAGVEVSVGSVSAIAFGYDECPVDASWYFNQLPTSNGCVKLSGVEQVKVKLLMTHGVIVDSTWRVHRQGYSVLIRDLNGQVVSVVSNELAIDKRQYAMQF